MSPSKYYEMCKCITCCSEAFVDGTNEPEDGIDTSLRFCCWLLSIRHAKCFSWNYRVQRSFVSLELREKFFFYLIEYQCDCVSHDDLNLFL